MKLQKMNLDDFEKMLNKVIDYLWKFAIGACIVGFLGTGLFMILAYGIPLGSYEQDMEMVFRGIQMIVVLLVIVMVGVAWWKILEAFLDYL